MQDYLNSTSTIDWQQPQVLQLARQLAAAQTSPQAIAKACFEWVRDEIRHSYDYRLNPVTCRASEVLEFRTGYCYAKSHLLAALLRANRIPAGFCYQRLSVNDDGEPYCLHGFNAVHLPEWGWYRCDARGNKAGVDAEFVPPVERLAFQPRLPEERDFSEILPEPLPMVVEALQRCSTWEECLADLPDAIVI